MSHPDLFNRMAPYGFDSGATFSPDRVYRYRLWRSWGDRERRVVFVMLNPSTADETEPDPTITKCIGFAKRWGFEALDVVNLFAYVSPYPKSLRDVADPVGPENDEMLRHVLAEAGRIVLAWGTHAPVRSLIADRLLQLHALGLGPHDNRKSFRFGRCADGSPMHPLMLPYSTELEHL